MNEQIQHRRQIIHLASRPSLRPHMKFRHDPVRDRWVILGPERILTPNEQAVDVLKLCDGERTVAEIADLLAGMYDAEQGAIASDIIPLLQDLADTGVIRP
jgi:pyrroloquinoline quinone biosynthesis protein D